MTEKKKEKYPIGDIDIQELKESNSDHVKNFKCQIKDLEDFLKDDALRHQNEGVSVTNLWLSKEKKVILGYITLCTDSIRLEGKKKEEMRKIGIAYKTLPALKIARTAVHDDYRGQGIGTNMVAFATDFAIKLSNQVGCRFLTLEAKNLKETPEAEKPIHFYKKLGFEITKERKQDPTYIAMNKDLGALIKTACRDSVKKAPILPNNR